MCMDERQNEADLTEKGRMAVSPAEVEEIGRKLVQLGVKKIYTGHCTGQPAFAILQKTCPEAVQALHTGLRLEF